MGKKNSSIYAGITVTLTVEGRLALASEALAAARSTCNKKRRRNLCDQAMNQLRSLTKQESSNSVAS